MKIKDRYTGELVPGDWEHIEDMEVDIVCSTCHADIGQQCSFPDLDNEGLGIEVSGFVHSSRISL